jgi:predicted outer membrane protein
VKRILASLVFVLFMAAPGIAVAQPNPTLSALDAELIVKVRLAGLWEMPAGEIAQERSANPKVQEVGRTLMTDHAQLDIEVRRVAALYNLTLPAEPNDAQKGWLTEMATASGSQFDSVWAMRLRAAHGMIFTVIAKSRAATADPEIRKFATTANTIVMKHMTILESTGVVDFAALEQPLPVVLASDADGIDMVVALTLVPLVVAMTIFTLWMAAGRNRRRGALPLTDEPEDEGRAERGGRRRRDETRGTKLFADKEYAR